MPYTYKIANFQAIASDAVRQSESAALADDEQTYAAHYVILLEWFRQQNDRKWTSELVLMGGLAVYGWMPTILRTDITKLDEVAKSLNMGQPPARRFLNNSVVGSSKFLHFWRPDKYAIWDSNIAKVLELKTNSEEHYENYLHDIRHFAATSRRKSIRYIEFALFREGRRQKKEAP
jgi:hypothetical protein